MAFQDWNKDGKKDIRDDFIEFDIYEQSNHKNNNNYRSSRGISNFGAGCGTVITFVLSATITGSFGLEGNALVIVFFILFAIIGGCIAYFFDKIGF